MAFEVPNSRFKGSSAFQGSEGSGSVQDWPRLSFCCGPGVWRYSVTKVHLRSCLGKYQIRPVTVLAPREALCLCC